jgi:K+-transporting ATPase ATPase C chain
VISVNGPAFIPTYEGVPVESGSGEMPGGVIVPIRGDAPAHPVVPPDAVTASGSGLDPDISPAYANLQAPRIARKRGFPLDRVHELIKEHTDGRALGFLGEPGVNVLELNMALDNER